MVQRATGTLSLELRQETQEQDAGVDFTRWSADKVFQGDLEATSRLVMLTARVDDNATGAYVALERVIGTLGGCRGPLF